MWKKPYFVSAKRIQVICYFHRWVEQTEANTIYATVRLNDEQ